MRAVRSRLVRNAHLLSGSVACLLKSATTAHRPSSRLVGWHCTTSLLSMRLCGELGIQAGDRILAILCSERRTVTNLRRWLPCRLEAGCREGMTISVAQRKAIHLVAQMLRCDTVKKLRHSQSKGSRTSKNSPEAASSIDGAQGARGCKTVRDRAALRHAPRRPPACSPPCRCRSSTEGRSGGASAERTSIRRELLRVAADPRQHAAQHAVTHHHNASIVLRLQSRL
jgi:hypothetical protein